MGLLDQINSPKDLKAVPREALTQLAQEVREKILAVIADKGGHLGASLGTVELAIALHTVFDPPQDRLVWDTGHQAYPHKLLTGRRDLFHTLRQYQGISGFLSRAESPTTPSAPATPARPSRPRSAWRVACRRRASGGKVCGGDDR
ncbi:MAG: hypothetical protein MPW15_01200 [Candidatus Manganitrophus sp.]|nr:hypothetical protein [Candidatus Manganitrophus sp.]